MLFLIFSKLPFIYLFVDSKESAAKEISYFFPEFNIDEWRRTMEPSFKSGELIFNETSKIHELLNQPTTSDHTPKLEI